MGPEIVKFSVKWWELKQRIVTVAADREQFRAEATSEKRGWRGRWALRRASPRGLLQPWPPPSSPARCAWKASLPQPALCDSKPRSRLRPCQYQNLQRYLSKVPTWELRGRPSRAEWLVLGDQESRIFLLNKIPQGDGVESQGGRWPNSFPASEITENRLTPHPQVKVNELSQQEEDEEKNFLFPGTAVPAESSLEKHKWDH